MTSQDFICDEPSAGDPRGRLTTVEQVRAYALAGNATVTLVSTSTGKRFTYRLRATEKQDPPSKVSHFVNVMNGADNEGDFVYLGHVFATSHDYVHGRKSRIGAEAPSAKAFAWFWAKVIQGTGDAIPAALEVWHEGRCGACGRKLTVPESIARGLGPECAGRLS